MFLWKQNSVGIGFSPGEFTVQARIRGSAALKGAVVQFDLRNNDAAVLDNNLDGGDDSGFGNVIRVTAPSLTTPRKIYAIVRGQGEGSQASGGNTFAQDSVLNVMLFGVGPCLVYEPSLVTGGGTADGAIAKDDDLTVIGGSATPPASLTAMVTVKSATGGTGQVAGAEYPIIAKCLATVADSTTIGGVMASCYFWGGLPFGINQQ